MTQHTMFSTPRQLPESAPLRRSPLVDAIDASPLVDAIECARQASLLLREGGRYELAIALDRELDRPRAELPTVVVVGETKRGKSSLVNALLGRPNLSPVDVDVATCVHIAFRYSPVEYARISIAGQQDPIEIGVDNLFEWAAESGNPGNVKGVTAIEVGLAVDVLKTLTVIDTPGVGGLELGHAELTLQALGSADAILFVVDAGAPMTRTELEFLRRAAERIDTVAFALTKIDLYPGWRRIHGDNQALLRRYAPRFASAPMMAMSSVNAERALALGIGPAAREERRRAGLDALESVLTGFIAARSRLLSAANMLRFSLRAISELREVACAQVAAASGDPMRQRELDAEQARLATLVPHEAQWRRGLDSTIAKLALAREGELRQRLDDLQRQYVELANKHKGAAELQQLSGQLVAAVEAMTRQLAEQTATQLIRAVTEVIDVLADDGALRESLARVAASTDGVSREYAPDPQKRLTGLELFTAVTPMLSIDRLLTFIPSTLGIGLVATGPIGFGVGIAAMVVGSGAAMILAKERKRISAQGSFVAWVRDYVAAVRDAEQRSFATALIDARRDLAQALDDGIRRRSAEIARDSKLLAAAQSETVAQRSAAIKVATDRLARVDALNRRAQLLLRNLQQARATDLAVPA